MTEDAARAGAVDVAALRAKHRRAAGDCGWCGYEWPCEVIEVLDALAAVEQAFDRLAESKSGYWLRATRAEAGASIARRELAAARTALAASAAIVALGQQVVDSAVWDGDCWRVRHIDGLRLALAGRPAPPAVQDD